MKTIFPRWKLVLAELLVKMHKTRLNETVNGVWYHLERDSNCQQIFEFKVETNQLEKDDTYSTNTFGSYLKFWTFNLDKSVQKILNRLPRGFTPLTDRPKELKGVPWMFGLQRHRRWWVTRKSSIASTESGRVKPSLVTDCKVHDARTRQLDRWYQPRWYITILKAGTVWLPPLAVEYENAPMPQPQKVM